MSLVGPRPHATFHHSQFGTAINCYAIRHNIKPGITGWAQVNGLRGETPLLDQMIKRVEYDLWYIRHWTIALDFWILLRTAFAVIGGKNAH